MQYRWRRCFRDAERIAKAIIPYSLTKKDKLQIFIDHYENDKHKIKLKRAIQVPAEFKK